MSKVAKISFESDSELRAVLTLQLPNVCRSRDEFINVIYSIEEHASYEGGSTVSKFHHLYDLDAFREKFFEDGMAILPDHGEHKNMMFASEDFTVSIVVDYVENTVNVLRLPPKLECQGVRPSSEKIEIQEGPPMSISDTCLSRPSVNTDSLPFVFTPKSTATIKTNESAKEDIKKTALELRGLLRDIEDDLGIKK